MVAIAEHDDQQAANIIRLLLLTGARRGEVQAARWEQFDLTAGVWTKPGATTKQKTMHRVPLSGPARQLLASIYAEAADGAVYVFPGRSGGHRVEFKRDWAAICTAAGIAGVRIHDLRHSYASILASAGLSLPIIGALLGHTHHRRRRDIRTCSMIHSRRVRSASGRW
jgi:integrase